MSTRLDPRDNPREALEKFYSIDTTSAIRPGVADKLVPKRQSAESPCNYAKGRNEQRAIEQLFKEPRISLEQREVIATSILAGRVEMEGSESEEEGDSIGIGMAQQAQTQAQSQVQKRPQPRLRPRDYERERIATLTFKRHNLPPSAFLSLETRSSPIPVISGRDVIEARRVVQRSIGASLAPLSPTSAFRSPDSTSVATGSYADSTPPQSHSTPYSSANKESRHGSGSAASKSPSPGTGLVFTDSHPNSPIHSLGKRSGPAQIAAAAREMEAELEWRRNKASIKGLQNAMVAEHVRRRTARSLTDQRKKGDVAVEMRKLEHQGVERKMGVQKRIAEFKRSLKDYLKKARDPMVGEIMRCLDDSTIYDFLESYQGYSMTIPAILALIGSALNTSIVQPSIPVEVRGEEDLIYGRSEEMKGLYSRPLIKNKNKKNRKKG
jgi:ribosomal protein L29